MPVMLKGK